MFKKVWKSLDSVRNLLVPLIVAGLAFGIALFLFNAWMQ